MCNCTPYRQELITLVVRSGFYQSAKIIRTDRRDWVGEQGEILWDSFTPMEIAISETSP